MNDTETTEEQATETAAEKAAWRARFEQDCDDEEGW